MRPGSGETEGEGEGDGRRGERAGMSEGGEWQVVDRRTKGPERSGGSTPHKATRKAPTLSPKEQYGKAWGAIAERAASVSSPSLASRWPRPAHIQGRVSTCLSLNAPLPPVVHVSSLS